MGGAGGQRLRRGGGGPGRASAAAGAAGGSSGRGRARRKPCRCSSSAVSLRGRDAHRQHCGGGRPPAPLSRPLLSPARRYLCGRGPPARAQHHHAMLGASPRAKPFRGSPMSSCGRCAGRRAGRLWLLHGAGEAARSPLVRGATRELSAPLRTAGVRGTPGHVPCVWGRHLRQRRDCCRLRMGSGHVMPRPPCREGRGGSFPIQWARRGGGLCGRHDECGSALASRSSAAAARRHRGALWAGGSFTDHRVPTPLHRQGQLPLDQAGQNTLPPGLVTGGSCGLMCSVRVCWQRAVPVQAALRAPTPCWN